MDLDKLSDIASESHMAVWYINRYEPAQHDDTSLEDWATWHMIDLALIIAILIGLSIAGYIYTSRLP